MRGVARTDEHGRPSNCAAIDELDTQEVAREQAPAPERSATGSADVLAVNRDLFYGLSALAIGGLFAASSRSTGYDLAVALRRRWIAALVLGLASAAVLAAMVVRTEDATARPDGLDLIGAVAWRGIVYGVTDGASVRVSDPRRVRSLRR